MAKGEFSRAISSAPLIADLGGEGEEPALDTLQCKSARFGNQSYFSVAPFSIFLSQAPLHLKGQFTRDFARGITVVLTQKRTLFILNDSLRQRQASSKKGQRAALL